MPGCSGVTVVTTLVCFYLFCTRGCGRIARPAFPAPSFSKGRDVDGKTRAKTRGEIAKLCLQFVHRHCEERLVRGSSTSEGGSDDPSAEAQERRRKQSILPWRRDGLLVRQASWRGPAGASPARVSRSGRPVVSVAWSSATAAAKRTQRFCGVGY